MKEIKDKIARLNDGASKEAIAAMLVNAIEHIASINPRMAEEMIDTYDGQLNYNNYLTEREAHEIVDSFINSDGTRGAAWKASDFFQKAESLEIELDHAPNYNRWALYVAAVHNISDQLPVIAKWTGNDVTRYVEFAVDLSLSQLNDKDRPQWIRSYFGL